MTEEQLQLLLHKYSHLSMYNGLLFKLIKENNSIKEIKKQAIIYEEDLSRILSETKHHF